MGERKKGIYEGEKNKAEKDQRGKERPNMGKNKVEGQETATGGRRKKD